MKTIVKGFVDFMANVKEAFDRSYNDQYAGWDEWRETELLTKVRMGI